MFINQANILLLGFRVDWLLQDISLQQACLWLSKLGVDTSIRIWWAYCWDRVKVAAKTWCGHVPTSTCPQARLIAIVIHLFYQIASMGQKLECYFRKNFNSLQPWLSSLRTEHLFSNWLANNHETYRGDSISIAKVEIISNQCNLQYGATLQWIWLKNTIL